MMWRLLALMKLVGFDTAIFAALRNLPRYRKEMQRFKEQGGVVSSMHPILNNYDDSAGVVKGHYFHQDLLVSQFIYDRNPARHLDIGSRIDGFVAHVASFREIEIMDTRPLSIANHPRIRFVQANLMEAQDDLNGKFDSLSCLHALEHFGLGRYSDPVDADGHLKGFNAISDLLAPGGTFYLSFPVGRERVEFNAHRVFDPNSPVAWAQQKRLHLQRFDLVDDSGDLHKNADIQDAVGLDFGCGIYTFDRPAT